jgi:hypothetical protein
MKVKRVLELTVVYPALTIAILGTVAIVRPCGHCCPRIHANESAAIATCRNIASAQMQFQCTLAVDLDGDGRGEAGTFREMSGYSILRRGAGPWRLDPPVLSGAFKHPSPEGEVTRSEYFFRILLPDGQGGWIVADTSALARANVDASEEHWCAYARPSEFREGQTRTFFVDESGEVLATNRKAPLPLDRPPDIEAHGWRLVR